jgi:hypothetical protein
VGSVCKRSGCDRLRGGFCRRECAPVHGLFLSSSGLHSCFADETYLHLFDLYIHARRSLLHLLATLGRHQRATIPTAASELHSLLAVQALAGVPLLVLANKNDLPEAMGVDEMIGAMGLERIRDRAVSVSTESPLPQLRQGLGVDCAVL